MTLEVLVATMNQTDFSKYYDMNINSDVIFTNQSNENKYEQITIDGNNVKMITTTTKGVGINRNIGLLNAQADILLFADDDVKYVDNYKEGILNAFSELPNADIIIFGIDIIKKNKVLKIVRNKRRKVNLINSLGYGSCVIAIKRNSILKSNIYFSRLFGGGTIYGSGEDSLFIRDCFSKGMKVYTHDFIIGSTSKEESTWFNGVNEKYFFDKGAWIKCAFPKIKYLLVIYFCIRMKSMTNLSLNDMIKYMIAGINSFSGLDTYDEYITKKK